MTPKAVAADPPISIPAIRPFIKPLFMRSLLPLIFGGQNHHLAVVPVHGEAPDALPPVQQVVPQAGGQLKGSNREAHLVDLRPGDGADPASVGGYRALQQGPCGHVPAAAGVVDHDGNLPQPLKALGRDIARAANARADPDAGQLLQILRQLRPEQAPDPPVPAYNRQSRQCPQLPHGIRLRFTVFRRGYYLPAGRFACAAIFVDVKKYCLICPAMV